MQVALDRDRKDRIIGIFEGVGIGMIGFGLIFPRLGIGHVVVGFVAIITSLVLKYFWG